MEQGLNAAAEGNVESIAASSVTLQGEAPYALRWLVETFEMTVGRITHDYIPDAQADLVLILGDDWASNNPMP
jgi:anti-sigma factor ChrR (cupin superfamily)